MNKIPLTKYSGKSADLRVGKPPANAKVTNNKNWGILIELYYKWYFMGNELFADRNYMWTFYNSNQCLTQSYKK